jgi:hypothetical protein
MQFSRKLTVASVVVTTALAFAFGCSSGDSEEENAGSGATSSGATGSGANGSGNSSSGGTISVGSGGDTGSGTAGDGTGAGPTLTPDGEAFCGDVACECSNGIDDDGDGQTDGFDIECQGPLDNDEGSFATGIPGDNKDESWVDCFFDGDSGSGNDGCKYPFDCLTGDLDPNSTDCEGAVSEACLNYCGPRTPNGCDCFGCCTIQLEGGETVDILTKQGCSLDDIDNEDLCLRCTKTDTCENTCGECELCPGKTVDDLPESCQPDPPAGGSTSDPPPDYTCEGAQVCSDTLPCSVGDYCSLGCCIPVVK